MKRIKALSGDLERTFVDKNIADIETITGGL